MLGGFLGAGKTTTIARLAKHFTDQGLSVGIVTNDQTTDLVDTQNLRAQGYDVGEVAGSCFCCNFNALTQTVEGLGEGELPQVILAEPVGSCTDLVATVLRPLVKIYKQPFDIAPYGVLLKPSHGGKILRNDPSGGFSPKAEYIFRKQLEEADFIVINRADTLPPAEIAALRKLVEEQFPGRTVLAVSAKTGEGFENVIQTLDQTGSAGRHLMDVDYDIYAEGEAELGWLNGQVEIKAGKPFAIDSFLLDVIGRLHARFVQNGAEAAHLKVIGMGDGNYAVANLVSNESAPELSLPSKANVSELNLVVNARVATDPAVLEQLVREEVAAACKAVGATHSFLTLQSFRPGRPVPTHRILTAT